MVSAHGSCGQVRKKPREATLEVHAGPGGRGTGLDSAQEFVSGLDLTYRPPVSISTLTVDPITAEVRIPGDVSRPFTAGALQSLAKMSGLPPRYMVEAPNDTTAWNFNRALPNINGDVAFVTDGRAISYAESCMGIVEAYKLGEIVGATTAGSNGNITTAMLPCGYSVTWTGMQVLKHDGSRHHGVGILPTVPVAPTKEGLAAGRDEVLEKAVEVVKAKMK